MNPSLDHFCAQRGQTYRLELDSGRILDLVLEQAEEHPATAGYCCFSLLFSGPKDSPLVQRIYPLVSAGSEPLDLFLVPVDADEQHYYYEAVFNYKQPAENAEPRIRKEGDNDS